MERHPLVDELLVIDSDSTDETRRIAESEECAGRIHSQVLPRYAALPQGEAL